MPFILLNMKRRTIIIIIVVILVIVAIIMYNAKKDSLSNEGNENSTVKAGDLFKKMSNAFDNDDSEVIHINA